MRFFIGFLFLINTTLAAPSLEWVASRTGEGGSKHTLITRAYSSIDYISLRQLCFALGCKVLYQWPNRRAVIRNPRENLSAIVSPATQLILIDGKIVTSPHKVLTGVQGYLVSMELASKLAEDLKLGIIRSNEKRKTKEELGSSTGNYDFDSIMIDPGHGGNDHGTAFGALSEKDITLIYALKLRNELKQKLPHFEIFLTREEDRFVSLPDRARIANEKHAQLFISLHVNHSANPAISGTETYILSPDATDDEAKRVALLENESWLKSSQIKNTDDAIKKILVDVEQTKYVQQSALMASMFQQEISPLSKRFGIKSRGVKQAMFYVLSQVAMPSILVEMAFLSSPADRNQLMNLPFQDDFIRRLVVAVDRYQKKQNGDLGVP